MRLAVYLFMRVRSSQQDQCKQVKETTDAAAKQEAGTLLLLFHFIKDVKSDLPFCGLSILLRTWSKRVEKVNFVNHLKLIVFLTDAFRSNMQNK
ncbi:hypothetical protein YC2023_117136 [Brassica napus]